MQITAANVQLDSRHTAMQRQETRESLVIATARDSVGRPAADAPSAHAVRPEIEISEAGKAAQLAETSATAATTDPEKATDADPKLMLLRSLIQSLTGRRMKIFDAQPLTQAQLNTQPPPAPSGAPSGGAGTPTAQDGPTASAARYEAHTSYTEAERTSFTAKGTVRTADGRDIAFDLSLTMARSYHEERDLSVTVAEAAQAKDPLVLNFAGTAATLNSTRFSFDIDADGSAEQIASVGAGSGLLMIDRDGNGRATNGSELFGAATGDGFAELAALDGDKNGWIDEGDAAFDQLRVWTRDGQGTDRLQSLSDLGVGAIALGHTDTPFDLKTTSNEMLGQVRATGVFLRENGGAGTVQQVDFTV